MNNVKCEVWIKLWFVGEFCEKWVINHEMMFWWIKLYDYDWSSCYWGVTSMNFCLIMSFGYGIEFGEKYVFKLKVVFKWLCEINCFAQSWIEMFSSNNELK